MSQFFEVTCDHCQTWGLFDYRYKCLRCADYDLCARCYKFVLRGVGHDVSHPFQCLLDQGAMELHFAGEPIPDLCADSFTCPNCGELGFSADELMAHVRIRHSDARTAVICPLCVAVPSAHPARVDNLLSHMSIAHHHNPGGGFRLAGTVPPVTHHVLPTAEGPQVRFILPDEQSEVEW